MPESTWRSSQRMLRVDTPIIPTIAALVRETPGTISLGQGVVNYGPPAAALEAIAPMTAEPFNHKYQAVTGHPLLVPSAMEAVKQWLYKPTLLNGEPVEVVTVIDVNFTLSQ